MQFHRARLLGDPECVFLHLINRELHDSLDVAADTRSALGAIRLATIFCDIPLSCNVSQICEFAFEDDALLQEIVELSNSDVLDMDCAFPSFGEFHDSRRRYYQHDFGRYPMYATDKPDAIFSRLKMAKTPKVSSTTIGIHHRLEALLLEDGGVNKVAAVQSGERELLRRLGKPITRALDRREDAGLTYALFPARGMRFKNPTQEMALRRALTAAYIEHYLTGLHAEVLTSYPRLPYYDSASRTGASFFDLAVMRLLWSIFGMDAFLGKHASDGIEHRLRARNSPQQSLFVQRFMQLCSGLDEGFRETAYLTSGKAHWVRSIILGCTERLKLRQSYPSFEDFLLQCAYNLERVSQSLSQRLPGFPIGWQKYEHTDVKSALLMTATDLEDDTLYAQLKERGFQRIGQRTTTPNVYTEFVSPSGKRMFHARSSGGSVGPSGSLPVAMETLSHLHPTYLISAGICFGLDEKKQNLGDVAVAVAVKLYEPGKVKPNKFVDRGDRISVGSTLLDRVRVARREWTGAQIHFGLVVSGEKLVNARSFRRFLKSVEPEAIAGEMEAAGIVSACQRSSREFLLIKGIADWGMSKSDDHQRKAASNAFSLALATIDLLPT
jgi:nucleoside phosphorylase